jgi:hypothetical protein
MLRAAIQNPAFAATESRIKELIDTANYRDRKSREVLRWTVRLFREAADDLERHLNSQGR